MNSNLDKEMDRYNDVKVLLKNWELSFVQQNNRKPNKDDIDTAPDDTKKLYREYRMLKQAKETTCSGTSGHSDNAKPAESQKETESDCWGSHLNRKNMPTAVPKLTSPDRDSLRASAQYYGLKLKSNLGASVKERSVSLKKTYTPRRAAVKSWKEGPGPSDEASSPGLQPRPANTCPDPCAALPQTSNAPAGMEPFETVPAFTPSKALSPDALARKARLLRQSATRRLTSVDSGWLKRCQVFDEVENKEKPVSGNFSPAGGGGAVVPEAAGDYPSPGTPARSSEATVKILEGAHGSGRKPLAARVASAPSPAKSPPSRPGGPGPSSKAGREDGDGETRRGRTGEAHGGAETPAVDAAETGRPPAGDGEDTARGPEASRAGPEEKGPKRKSRKRLREGDAVEGERPDEAEEGAAKKRRRTKKGSAEGPAKSPSARGGRKKAAKVSGGSVDDPEPPAGSGKTAKPKVPLHNILGEEEAEDIKARSARMKNTVKVRAPKNSDGNFVKINLKKKSHVKGFALRGAALRKQMYLEKFQLKGERFGGGSGRGGRRFGGYNPQGDSCFKCGGTGHWARDCKGRAAAPVATGGGAEGEEEAAELEPFELPTLREVALATGTLSAEPLAPPGCAEGNGVTETENEEALLNVMRPDYEKPPPPPPMEPLYGLGEDGKVQAAPPEVYEALTDFGYKSFRPGQEMAIMRILSGLSTLVVLSTGMGKSLCYQLPAYLYAQRSNSIALVVSPLVSLMDDQLSGLPPKLKAACIHSNMSKKQREAAIEKVKAGLVHVLLLSPEALVGGGHSGSACLPPADQLPPVAFACIDEAHCVSEWSHNFRPCYLRLCKVLRDRLGVRCLLGLTATATLSTALDIAQHLEIRDQEGIALRSAAVPLNLQLSVSTDRDKDQALVTLLKGERFGSLDSIIVYCTRREETTRISALLRTCLQGVKVKESANAVKEGEGAEENPVSKKKKALARKKIRKPLKWIAESYHAGLSAGERRRVQNNFMCGELRLVVATVAFGMGLDKSDVRAVIHYNMPKSFESYVQEIGRAGRDGHPAHCHLFLDPEGGDLHELRRHIYADTVDYFTIKKLVQKAFPSCKCKKIHQKRQDLTKAWEVDDSEMMELMETCEDAAPRPRQQDGQPTEDGAPGPEPELPEGWEHKQEEEEDSDVDRLQGGSRGSPVVAERRGDGGEQNSPEEPSAEQLHLDGQTDEERGEGDLPPPRVCHTHERAIPIQDMVEALDITEEGLETLLCYLELHPQQWVELLHPTLSSCRLVCYSGPQQLRKLTKICPPVAVALARKRMAGEKVEVMDSLEFDVVELADTMGWQLPLVKRGLRQLQWSSERGMFGGTGKSGVLVELSNLSFYFRSYGDLTADEMDGVCEFLHRRVQAQEKTQLYQLKACFKAFRSVAYRNCSYCTEEMDESRSLMLKELLSDYFDKKRDLDLSKKYNTEEEDEEDEELSKFKMKDWEDQIRADIRSFLACRSDEKFSGRAVARVFHGIGSPCYPAQTYGRDRRFWRKYIQFDFNEIIRFATQEIIRTR
ncbi:ATP-dependent DNA helicase Q4 [Conger conger]|uniref:ATP-dependent DNA helicase Q4 n=1 Tax=Conger conger TaxID=82655 RepID=UPI002A5A67A2|nr:ATP-dependent DNA helicase Q4 [Conger conger]XP_061111180.1 ATP-dependent DNA helicase Q4 [Conger conger]